jgi:hypothetical protein
MRLLRYTFAAACIVMLAQPSGCARKGVVAQEEQIPMQSPIKLKAEIQVQAEAIEVTYTVANESSEPVIILDRFFDRRKKSFDANWAYVEIRGGKALIKRAMERKPDTLPIEHPQTPYGRELKPGESLEASFSVPVPLEATNPYLFYSTPNAVTEEVQLTDIGFLLAWTAVPPEPLHPSMRKIEHDGETLQPFSYYYLDGKQRFLMAEPVTATIKGLVKVAPQQ